MTTRQIAYRLKSEGKAEVIRDQREIKAAMAETYAGGAQAADQATAATDRLERKYRSMAAAARDAAQASKSQADFNTWMRVDTGGGKSARDSAGVFASYFDEMEDAERRAQALRKILDPLGAAQDRLNAEMAEYATLAKRGAISSDELALAQARAKARFDETAAAIGRQERGLSRLVVASRLNLARQGADVAVTAAMGMNPAMIAIQQGPQILDAMATSGIRVTGVMVATAGAITAVAGGTALLAAAWHSGEAAGLDYDRAVTGLGRTAGLTATELEALTIAAADQGRVSVASAREQALAYISTGRIGAQQIGELIRLGKDYASVMGMDAEDATKALADAMLHPDKAGRELTRTMGLLDQKTLDQIDSLMEAGNLLGAQKLLLDALSGAVSGHAEKLGEIESAWDGIARAASNAWEWMGRALWRNESERLQGFIDQRAAVERRGGPRGPSEQAAYDRWGAEASAIQQGREARQAREADAAANQQAQIRHDAEDAKKKPRSNRSAEREAERAAREALQRQRREEDVKAALEAQIAQATNDFDRVRALQEEERVRTRIRQLVDDGMTSEAARTKATEEQARLQAALDVHAQREANDLARQASIEADRVAGLDRFVQIQERSADLDARILRYRQAGYDLITATSQAAADLLAIDKARADQIARANREAAAEEALTLARARGDTNAVRRLEADDWIRRRAQEIEQRNSWNAGEGGFEAKEQWQALLTAEAAGARRSWVRGFASDIRQSGIGNALGDQFDYAGERLLNKVIDGFLDFDWSSIFSGKSGGSGVGSWINAGLSWLFGGKGVGKNAAGTDYWAGGPTWVGERGPELLDLPRGSKITEHNRSMQLAAAGARGGSQAVAFTFAPVIHAEGAGPREVEAIRAEMQALARSLPSIVPRIVNDARARRIIA